MYIIQSTTFEEYYFSLFFFDFFQFGNSILDKFHFQKATFYICLYVTFKLLFCLMKNFIIELFLIFLKFPIQKTYIL